MIFKIASWNLNSIRSRISHLLSFIDEHNPDVICLQELKCSDTDFPYDYFRGSSYKLYINGQKAYNGVAILSKIDASLHINNFPDNPIPNESRFIEIKINIENRETRIISLYVPNGGEVGSDKFDIKLEFYKKFTSYLSKINQISEDVIICTDSNIAPFEIDMYSETDLQDTTCCNIEGQKKLRTIFNMNFFDNYRLINPHKREYSWWDYKAGAFYKNNGLRIDSIISSCYITNYLIDSRIIIDERKREKPSDHAPIISTYSIST